MQAARRTTAGGFFRTQAKFFAPGKERKNTKRNIARLHRKNAQCSRRLHKNHKKTL
ncbi:hypothetical protein SUBVAR_06710 [Subdoligranulum variabile DSM 15176]|uniref:Uncharacterized protein n=1 Tax=Subdoligranulum variabile DSM 15176 TaxID=411471 RepID=D1PQP1_9FIRM|nr:hypothetical protein SUBVAR_06710 [Subdoligranulum variabile DSM 15176]